MTTPTALPSTGFFAQLMPMLAERTLMLIVSKVDDQHLTLSVVPKRMKEGENTALATPLCCTGTPDELDRDLPAQLRDFVAGHVALSNNLAQIQREREEAEKAAREELKKKQKTVGNGGVRAKVQECGPKSLPSPTGPQQPVRSAGHLANLPRLSIKAREHFCSISPVTVSAPVRRIIGHVRDDGRRYSEPGPFA